MERYPHIVAFIQNKFHGKVSLPIRREVKNFIDNLVRDAKERSLRNELVADWLSLQDLHRDNGSVPYASYKLQRFKNRVKLLENSGNYLDFLYLCYHHPTVELKIMGKYITSLRKVFRETSKIVIKKFDQMVSQSRDVYENHDINVGNYFDIIKKFRKAFFLGLVLDEGTFLLKMMHSEIPLSVILGFVFCIYEDSMEFFSKKIKKYVVDLYSFFQKRENEVHGNNSYELGMEIVLQVVETPNNMEYKRIFEYYSIHKVFSLHYLRRGDLDELVEEAMKKKFVRFLQRKGNKVAYSYSHPTSQLISSKSPFLSSTLYDCCSGKLVLDSTLKKIHAQGFPVVRKIPLEFDPKRISNMEGLIFRIFNENPYCEVFPKIDGIGILVFVIDWEICVLVPGAKKSNFRKSIVQYISKNIENRNFLNGHTYIFEAVFENTSKVINYQKEKFGLYLLAIFNEKGRDLSHPKVQIESYRLRTKAPKRRIMKLLDVINEVREEQKKYEDIKSNSVTMEGYVVRPLRTFRRFQIILPEYSRRKEIIHRLSPFTVWRSIFLNVSDVFLQKLSEVNPKYSIEGQTLLKEFQRRIKLTGMDLCQESRKGLAKWKNLLNAYYSKYGKNPSELGLRKKKVISEMKHQILRYLEPKLNQMGRHYKFSQLIVNVLQDGRIWEIENQRRKISKLMDCHFVLSDKSIMFIGDFLDTESLVNFSMVNFQCYLVIRRINRSRFAGRIEKYRKELDYKRHTITINVEPQESVGSVYDNPKFKEWKERTRYKKIETDILFYSKEKARLKFYGKSSTKEISNPQEREEKKKSNENEINDYLQSLASIRDFDDQQESRMNDAEKIRKKREEYKRKKQKSSYQRNFYNEYRRGYPKRNNFDEREVFGMEERKRREGRKIVKEKIVFSKPEIDGLYQTDLLDYDKKREEELEREISQQPNHQILDFEKKILERIKKQPKRNNIGNRRSNYEKKKMTVRMKENVVERKRVMESVPKVSEKKKRETIANEKEPVNQVDPLNDDGDFLVDKYVSEMGREEEEKHLKKKKVKNLFENEKEVKSENKQEKLKKIEERKWKIYVENSRKFFHSAYEEPIPLKKIEGKKSSENEKETVDTSEETSSQEIFEDEASIDGKINQLLPPPITPYVLSPIEKTKRENLRVITPERKILNEITPLSPPDGFGDFMDPNLIPDDGSDSKKEPDDFILEEQGVDLENDILEINSDDDSLNEEVKQEFFF